MQTQIAIEYHGFGSLMVSAPCRLTDDEVRSQVGSGWELPGVWSNVIDGRLVMKPNPYRNEGRGVWVWFLYRKVRN